jgi:hypothetical protein
MRLISRRLGLAALVAAALTTASSALADTVIDTTGSLNGSVAPWGTPDSGATPTYGQVFVDPAGNPFLQSMSFRISNGNATAIPFQAYVYNWTGTAITGNALFASSPQAVAPTGSSSTFANVTVNTTNLQLTPGNTYVAFFSTIGFAGPIDSSAWQLATQASYPQGMFAYNNSSTFSGLFTPNPPWNNLGNFGNLATVLRFTTLPIGQAVPEPGPLALAGVASLFVGLPVVLRRRKK